MRYLFVGLLMSMLAVFAAANGKAAGRSFEECQARAVALGIHASRTGRVYQRYLRYKAAGTAIRPRGFMARCMAGTG
jgi:hypothetical protein